MPIEESPPWRRKKRRPDEEEVVGHDRGGGSRRKGRLQPGPRPQRPPRHQHDGLRQRGVEAALVGAWKEVGRWRVRQLCPPPACPSLWRVACDLGPGPLHRTIPPHHPTPWWCVLGSRRGWIHPGARTRRMGPGGGPQGEGLDVVLRFPEAGNLGTTSRHPL
eukprot:scaffold7521_cov129-Ochromonas_danica.AAC.1